MTSIFLPIILGSFALVIKDIPQEEHLILFLIWIIVVAMLTYWWQVARHMHKWNATRKEQLLRLEKLFNDYISQNQSKKYDNMCFKQYGLSYKKGFNNYTKYLYFLLLAVTFLILIVKIFT
jgi:hypothetical protein